MIRDLTAVFDWLADWPADAGETAARDSGRWPWLLFEARLTKAIVTGYVKAYDANLVTVGKRDTFTHLNPDAVAAAYRDTAALVRQITADTRRVVQQVMGRGFSQGEAWPVITRRLAAVIGPLPKTTEAIQRRMEDRQTAWVEAGGDPVSARDKALQMARRERDRATRLRARTIARTETTRANVHARRDSWTHADQQGLIPAHAKVEWLAYDPCPRCQGLGGTQIPYNASWPDGDPPLHPNCRCTLLLVT